MASNNSDNKQTLELLLKCALCNGDLDENNQPKSLPCLHTFCTPCLTNQHQRFIQDNNIFKCPVCHTSVDRSSEDSGIIENLKLDIIIEKLLHVRRLQHSERYCEICPETGVVSTHWCQECCKFLCDSCLVPHGIYKPKDKIIDVSQGVDFDKVSDFMLSTKCSRHEKKFKMYCSQCEICLCMACALEHRSNENENCVIDSIDALMPDKKSQGRQLLEETRSHLEKEKQQIEDIEIKIANLNRYYSEKSEEIWEHVEETTRRLKENARTFIGKLKAETKSEIDELEKLIQVRQDHIKEMEIIDKNFRQLLQSFNNVDVLLNYPRMESKRKNLLMKPNNNILSTLHGLNTVYDNWYLGTHKMSKNVPLARYWKNSKLTDFSSSDTSSDTNEELDMPLSFLPPPVPYLEYPKSGELVIEETDLFGIFVTDKKHVLIGSGPPLNISNYNEKNELIDKFLYDTVTFCSDWCQFPSDEICLSGVTTIWLRTDDYATSLKFWKHITPSLECYSICNCFGTVLVCDYYCGVHSLKEEETDRKTVLNLKRTGSSFHKIRCGPFKDTFLLFDDEYKKLSCYNLSNIKCLFSLEVGNVMDLCTDKYGNIYVAEQDEVYVLSPDSLEKRYFFAIKPQGHNHYIFVKDDVFYFASNHSGKWMLEKFRLHYHQRSSTIDEE